MATDFRRGDTGINTAEGQISGPRAARLAKQRQEDQKEYESKRQKIQDEYHRGALKIDDKFGGSATDQYEAMFKATTVGLVTAEEFKKARVLAETGVGDKEGGEGEGDESVGGRGDGAARRKKKRKKKKLISTLSFGEEIEEEDGDGENGSGGGAVAKSGKKNPNVDTSFLPDRERERGMLEQREKLKKEWLEDQEKTKMERLEVTYSYWDGSGHRREIVLNKGITVGKFLEMVRQQLSQDFSEMRSVSSENLLYIKEDLIIPHHFSFYDLIVTKARGKSGPLFHFDVHDDIRIVHDTRIEKDESHPGKIVERRWYERNKHIFPASRWETGGVDGAKEGEGGGLGGRSLQKESVCRWLERRGTTGGRDEAWEGGRRLLRGTAGVGGWLWGWGWGLLCRESYGEEVQAGNSWQTGDRAWEGAGVEVVELGRAWGIDPRGVPVHGA
eukprot:jgi/Undpi1/4440/HiC_scaffold_17.g07794.m1